MTSEAGWWYVLTSARWDTGLYWYWELLVGKINHILDLFQATSLCSISFTVSTKYHCHFVNTVILLWVLELPSINRGLEHFKYCFKRCWCQVLITSFGGEKKGNTRGGVAELCTPSELQSTRQNNSIMTSVKCVCVLSVHPEGGGRVLELVIRKPCGWRNCFRTDW